MSDFIKTKARPEIFTLKPYIPGKPIEEVKRELGIDDIIKMASNENPMGASPKAIKAIGEVLKQIHLYPDANCFYLKEKLSSYLGVPTDSLLIGNGSDELLKLIAETFLSPSDKVIFADPSFVEYEFTAKIMGAECIAVPLVDFKYDTDSILKEIDEKTKIVYICNPNNPTGTVLTEKEIDEFMAKISDDILVIFDEAYYEFANDPEFKSGLKFINQNKNVIVLRTFSKIYGLAALRIGYAITTQEIAAAVERVTEPFNVNMLAQVGAAAALDDIEHIKNTHEENTRGKNFLYQEFTEMGLKFVKTEANFIFVDTGKDSKEVFEKLMQKGIIIRPGFVFGYPTFIRVTIGSEEENKRFIDSLKLVLED